MKINKNNELSFTVEMIPSRRNVRVCGPLITSLDGRYVALPQVYVRIRAQLAGMPSDEMKNQWGWGSFHHTEDLHRCRLMAGNNS